MSDYIDIPAAARALGKSTDAIRTVIERHDVPIRTPRGAFASWSVCPTFSTPIPRRSQIADGERAVRRTRGTDKTVALRDGARRLADA
jgi:hypothetical protein